MKAPHRLQRRVMGFVGLTLLLSCLGTALSLVRITGVQTTLNTINKMAVPLGRLSTQLKADADLLAREMDRRLSDVHWNEPGFRAQPVPGWIQEVIDGELARATELISEIPEGVPEVSAASWKSWAERTRVGFDAVKLSSQKLYHALTNRETQGQVRVYPHEIAPEWKRALVEFRREVGWASEEIDRLTRETFRRAHDQVYDLRTGMQTLLVAVIVLSLILLWFGERALRPLSELTKLAQEIATRGLRKSDKAGLPEMPMNRNDEVSDLAREFHRMATALLERERTVETQKGRLEEQNQKLRDMLEERIRMQDRLQKAEQLAAVGRMSAQVAHEVRNPLHAIGLEAEMAQEMVHALPSNPKLKQALESILDGVDRLQEITENYLKLSRLSTGQRSLIDLGETLERVLAGYAAQIESAKIKIDWKREEHVPVVVADRGLIEQVLGNLLRNSVQALIETGTETPQISWRVGAAESGRAFVRVEDNGPGVPEKIRERLFEPFLTSRAAGTGLGLSFVKQVLDEHRAEIRYSARVGGGASFEILFPVAPSVEVSHGAHPAR